MVYFRAPSGPDSARNPYLEYPQSFISLPAGFRPISVNDVGRKFSTGEALMDRYDLGYYYGRSLKPDTMVIVKTLDEEIAGLALLILEGDRIVIEMLSRNILLNVPGTGDQLLRCIEEYVAEQLDINEICLESLDREKLVSFYSRRGYIRSGPSTYDRDWGVLHPMTKRIVSIRN